MNNEEKNLHEHDENCDCGCNHEEGYQTITLTLDDDSEMVCIVLGIFECEDNEYIALLPEDKEEGEDVFLYRYKEIDEEEVELDLIESEEEFEKVSKAFEEIFDDEEEE
ncbi:DUF1292 domain-containing protein [Peptoniphilus sp. AGMB00490]|uniref:DUF1292 domain-containing protein n=1 Tax=Peptoniphilus faecalis TaxID=2731255 RepID=A0A848RF70_9FIRM|nr:DUF1292 domain-containing protein [Peptoniphilus faecalis]NMW84655.1 DUF1292 domain-containing protein [Peptoniphilus faecalis]